MPSKQITLILLEPSPIIQEGLSTILMKLSGQVDIHRAINLDDLVLHNNRMKLDVAIINPSYIQSNLDYFLKIKSEIENIYWIGLIYSYYDQSFLDIFHERLQINDPADVIINKIRKLLSSEPIHEQITKNVLSDREIDVLKLLVKGNSNKEIADKLFISSHTVITHRKNISQKTGIKSVSGLTIFAVLNHMVDLDQYNN